jgi:hypothetical protein
VTIKVLQNCKTGRRACRWGWEEEEVTRDGPMLKQQTKSVPAGIVYVRVPAVRGRLRDV